MFERLLIASTLTIALTSCGQLIGADDYSVQTGEDDSTTPHRTIDMVEIPLLPAQPDADRVPDCEACAVAECSEKRDACLESERCTRLLECSGTCSDPGCIYRCRDLVGQSPVFDEYYACVLGAPIYGIPGNRCRDACGSDGSWDCVGEYTWGPNDPGEAVLDVEVYTLGFRQAGPYISLPYIEIAVCEEFLLQGEPTGDSNCGDWTAVDEYGSAQMTLGRVRSAFAVRGGLRGRQRSRIYTRPVQRSGALRLGAFNDIGGQEWMPLSLGAQGVDVDPAAGTVSFYLRDCTASAARGRYEISDAGTEAVRYYWVGWGVASLDVETGVQGGFGNVSPGGGVRLSAHVDDQEVAERQLVVGSGWVTEVVLYPATR